MQKLLFFYILAVCISCTAKKDTLFTKLPAQQTGIAFRNELPGNDATINILTFPYYYNGGGVAVGDINNDGLPDLCFTGNRVANKLYLNRGNLQFEDITEKSGIAAKGGWSNGATMADVNGDGHLDIYICRSGPRESVERRNLLYINQGNGGFKEEGAAFGLDDAGFSTQASFFDYDIDGDLDLFLINQANAKSKYMERVESVVLRSQRADSLLENKLFRNDGGHFKNVTAQAGIRSNKQSYSLGLSTADINGDSWPDLYIANDFKEPDYLYINNRNGTFTDSIASMLSHTSLNGMGIDINDYNNDLLPDIVVVDMLSEGNHAQKMHMGYDGFDEYNTLFRNGLFPQYMKNTLQRNNGNGTFSEIGQLAGIANTDWSWSPLLADFDGDGFRDLFISNGYRKDVTDLEFLQFAQEQMDPFAGGHQKGPQQLIEKMPGLHLPNYMYRNTGNDRFENVAADWGLDEKTYSNAAAYADLDNDGDLDLVINNVDAHAGIYKNNSERFGNRFLKIKLEGSAQNRFGIGTKVYAFSGARKWMQEAAPVRGYQSSVDPVLHFGLGDATQLDSVVVAWPGGQKQVLQGVKSNQTLTLRLGDAINHTANNNSNGDVFFKPIRNGLDYLHTENEFNDFTMQTLLPHYYSRSGPCMTSGDVDGDGKKDVFIGGARGQAGTLYVNYNGSLLKKAVSALEADSAFEDVAALFFDADGDGDNDLYVGSGGYEFNRTDTLLRDRLYLNNGKGTFSKAHAALPDVRTSTGCIKAADADGDGDLDLFAGGRVVPGLFPVSPASVLLLNNGKGAFADATARMCPALETAGMVTDAVWADVNNDRLPDLITVGEWCAIKVYVNDKGVLKDASAQYIPFPSNGLWNSLLATDLDNDGRTDLVAGNQGLNNQFRASEVEPMQLFYNDFDGNGSVDPVLCYFIGGKSYPAYYRDDLTEQMPFLRKKFLHYNDYAKAGFEDLFSTSEREEAKELQVQQLATVVLHNEGTHFTQHPLPVEAQYAPVFAIAAMDVNKDSRTDLLLAGNNSYTRIRFSRSDAGRGVLLLNKGAAKFDYVPQYSSGLNIKGNVRSCLVWENQVLFGINNDKVAAYQLPSSQP